MVVCMLARLVLSVHSLPYSHGATCRHGFSMQNATWYDGTGFVSQCPIPRGQNLTVRFQVSAAVTCRGRER